MLEDPFNWTRISRSQVMTAQTFPKLMSSLSPKTTYWGRGSCAIASREDIALNAPDNTRYSTMMRTSYM